jgi:DNA-binding transcriptional LysR family regulator
MLNARQVTYFVAVARAGSLSKAALQLGVSQPALTKQIKLIEEQLRLRVFERTGRGVRLTPAGETVLDFASTIADQFEQLENALWRLRGAPSGAATVATTPLVARIITSPVALGVRAELPHVQLRVMEGYGAVVAQWVADGRVDIAVSYIPLSQVQHLIDGETLLNDEMVLIGPASLMAKHCSGGSIAFDALARLPLVLPTLQNGQRRWLEKVARERGFAFNLTLEIDSLSAMLDAVALGHGFTMLPCLAVAADLRDRGLVSATIVDPPVPAQLTLYSARGRATSAASQQVIRIIKREATKLRRETSRVQPAARQP